MNTPINNPAGRLYSILKEIKNNHTEIPLLAFAQIFDLDAENTSSILQSYTRLYQICEDVKTYILKVEKMNPHLYLEPIDEVILALSTIQFDNVNGLYDFYKGLKEETMIRLQYCSALLSGQFSEEIIEKEQLDKLYNEVNSLIIYIKDINMDPDLKALFIDNLENINIGITKYQIYGTAGIKSIVESCLGSMMLNAKPEKTEDEETCNKKILELITKLNQVFLFNKHINDQLIPISAYVATTFIK